MTNVNTAVESVAVVVVAVAAAAAATSPACPWGEREACWCPLGEQETHLPWVIPGQAPSLASPHVLVVPLVDPLPLGCCTFPPAWKQHAVVAAWVVVAWGLCHPIAVGAVDALPYALTCQRVVVGGVVGGVAPSSSAPSHHGGGPWASAVVLHVASHQCFDDCCVAGHHQQPQVAQPWKESHPRSSTQSASPHHSPTCLHYSSCCSSPAEQELIQVVVVQLV